MTSPLYLVPSVDDSQEIDDVPETLSWEEEDEPDRGFDRTWSVPNRTARVHWLDDGVLGVEMFAVTGKDRADVARDIRRSIAIYTSADMVDLVGPADDGDHLMAVLPVVAAVAPREVDPVLVPLFRRGLRHAKPLVRLTTLIAVSVICWQELRKDVERIATADPDEEARDLGRKILDLIDRASTD